MPKDRTEYFMQYAKSHRDLSRARCRRWYRRNAERERLRSKQKRIPYYARNRGIILSKNAHYLTLNKEKVYAKQKEWRERDDVRARRLAQMKQWNHTHQQDSKFRQKRSIAGAKHYQANKTRIAKRHKAWRNANREYFVLVKQRRRALEIGAAVNLIGIKSWIADIKSKTTAICYWCQHRISTKRIHFDHIVPLSKGGPHSLENLCVSCATCNMRKHAKSITAFVRVGQQVLNL